MYWLEYLWAAFENKSIRFSMRAKTTCFTSWGRKLESFSNWRIANNSLIKAGSSDWRLSKESRLSAFLMSSVSWQKLCNVRQLQKSHLPFDIINRILSNSLFLSIFLYLRDKIKTKTGCENIMLNRAHVGDKFITQLRFIIKNFFPLSMETTSGTIYNIPPKSEVCLVK